MNNLTILTKTIRKIKDGNLFPTKSRKLAMNLTQPTYYNSTYPWIDVIKSSGVNFTPINGASKNSDGWLTSIANGDSYNIAPFRALNPATGKAPAGSYVFKSTSTCTLSVSPGTGISAIVNGVGSCSFTISDLGIGNWGAFDLQINITNPGGGVKNFTDGYCCLASEEALLLAGELFKPDYLNDLRRCKALRAMDWFVTNNNPFSTLAEFGSQNLTKITYCLDNNGVGDPVPFKVFALLCKKLKCEAWCPIPPATKSRFFNYTNSTKTFTSKARSNYTTTQAHLFVQNERVMFNQGTIALVAPFVSDTIYYVVNPTSTTYQLATTPNGAPVGLTSGVDGTPPNYDFMSLGSLDGDRVALATSIAQEVFNVYPEAIVYAESGNEGWNGSFNQFGWNATAGSWLAQSSGVSPNASLGYAYSCLGIWKGVEAVFGTSGQVVRVFSHQTASFSGGMWDYIDPGVYSSGQTISQILAVGVATRSCYALAPYIIGNNGTVDRPSPDQIYADNGNSETIPDSYWFAGFARGIAPALGWVTSSVSGARGKVANIPVNTYEYGIDWFWQGSSTHALAIGTSMLAWLDGPGGLALEQAMYSTIVTGPGLDLCNRYVSNGLYVTSSGQMIQWGTKGHSGLPDTPRSTWAQFQI